MTRHYPHLGSAFTHVALSCAEASLYCGEAFVRFLFFSIIDILMGKRGLCGGESPRGRTNQKHYPELGTYTSSVWNFCSRMSFRGETSERWPAIVAGSVYSTFEVYSTTPKLCDVFESLESPFIWMSYNSPNKLAIKVTLITPVR